MKWVFSTHRIVNGTYVPVVLRWRGHAVYNGPQLFSCLAEGIAQADRLYEDATGIDPCKSPKGGGLTVTRLCPELRCNGGTL